MTFKIRFEDEYARLDGATPLYARDRGPCGVVSFGRGTPESLLLQSITRSNQMAGFSSSPRIS